MVLKPSVACLTRVSKPCLMRGPHAAESPALGAPAAPVVWQAAHVALYTASPPCSVFAPPASAKVTLPMGFKRSATASGDIQVDPAPCRLWPATYVASSTMIVIVTMNASAMTMTSCLGVLIGD